MDKVLIVIPHNNKGKYLAKGYSDAFKSMAYFVIEKKIYDLNVEEINIVKPDIIFIVWSQLHADKTLCEFLKNYNNQNTKIVNFAELLSDIPKLFQQGNNTFSFSPDAKKKKQIIMPAVIPDAYKRKFSGYKYMITFAGNPSFDCRERLLSSVVYNFGVINIFCRSYDFYKSVDEIYKKKLLDDKYIELYRDSYRGYVESQKELSFIYSHSKVNIDLPSVIQKPINYRSMEIMASGGFVIAPYNDIVTKYFENGKEIETYHSSADLIDKIRFYLNNTNLSLLIAIKGKRNTVSNHSFYDRLKVILKVINDKNSCNR